MLNTANKQACLVDCFEAWRAIEFFAGNATVTLCARDLNFRAVSLDNTDGGRHMDILTPIGMAFPFCNYCVPVWMCASTTAMLALGW